MANEENCASAVGYVFHLSQALLLKLGCRDEHEAIGRLRQLAGEKNKKLVEIAHELLLEAER